jgi:hypothetical protein
VVQVASAVVTVGAPINVSVVPRDASGAVLTLPGAPPYDAVVTFAFVNADGAAAEVPVVATLVPGSEVQPPTYTAQYVPSVAGNVTVSVVFRLGADAVALANVSVTVQPLIGAYGLGVCVCCAEAARERASVSHPCFWLCSCALQASRTCRSAACCRWRRPRSRTGWRAACLRSRCSWWMRRTAASRMVRPSER